MNKNGNQLTKEEILVIADTIKGTTFKEISYKYGNKGGFGLVIEEVFCINPNSRPLPDFEEAGIELKVTPYKINKNGTLSAKERLVLNNINYKNENLTDFHKSSFWKKNETMLIIFYLFDELKEKRDFMITNHLLHNFSENDLKIIKDDWRIIRDKIKNGEAHNISEADTLYLGACTKGVNSKSLVGQPFSTTIKAKPRAYSLKTTYMTLLIRKLMSKEKIEKIFDEKIETSFENQMRIKLNRFFGKSQEELKNIFKIRSNAKNINELLLSRMLGLKGKVSKSEEFLKANIIPKTVRVEEDGHIVESMSFPTFEFSKIINETWDDSELRDYFESTKFLFIVFKKENDVYVFKDIKLWNMQISILDKQARDVWEKTKELIETGHIIKRISGKRRFTYFPDTTFNGVCHVRPHAKDAEDTYELPVKDILTGVEKYTKHCFWLNNTFIKSIIS